MQTGRKTPPDGRPGPDRRPRHVPHLPAPTRRIHRQRGAAEYGDERHPADDGDRNREADAAIAGQGRRPGGSFATAAAGRGARDRGDESRSCSNKWQPLEQEQATAYAPVYYPGTASPRRRSGDAGRQRGARRRGLPAADSCPRRASAASSPARRAHHRQARTVALVPAAAAGVPNIPGLGNNTARVGADGRFTFNSVTPGDYVAAGARHGARGCRPKRQRRLSAARGGRGWTGRRTRTRSRRCCGPPLTSG